MFILGEVMDRAGSRVDLNFITFFNTRGRLLAFQNRQADIDGVAKEDTRKGCRDDCGYACGLDGNRGNFTGGSAAKIRLEIVRVGSDSDLVTHTPADRLIG